MESEENEHSATCPRCQKRPATTTYKSRRSKFSELVCDACVDLLDLMDTFEWGIVDTQKLVDQDRYDEVLAWIDAFDKANRHRDRDSWLAKAVARYRELVFWQAERYEEALAACDVVYELGFDDAWERWAAAGAKANVLQGLGRHAEALAAFEEAFSHQDPQHLRSAAYLLGPLVEFSANAGQPVNEKWRSVAEAVAKEFGVEMPACESLGESMLALQELTCGKRIDDEPEPEHG